MYGDLDFANIMKVGKNADIVYRNCLPTPLIMLSTNEPLHFADCDHITSANAIAKGVAGHTPENPVWLIYTLGTIILIFEDFRASSYGIERQKGDNN